MEQEMVSKTIGECYVGSSPTAPMISNPKVYSYLLGVYLGDGYINRFPRTYRLRIFQDKKYPHIIQEQYMAVRKIFGFNKIGLYMNGKSAVISCYSNKLPLYFPQHGKGKKNSRKIALMEWQRKIIERYPKDFLRGLIHSDGCRYNNKFNGVKYPAYNFSNSSEDIMNLFTWVCNLLGIKCRRGNETNMAITRRGPVKFMDSFIGAKA